MSTEREPRSPAAWPPRREGDTEYRYPEPYRLGMRPNENLASIAQRHHLGARDLVTYNFHTAHEHEINWYLLNRVKCPKPRGRYYRLSGAPYTEGGSTGVIYLPRYGEPRAHPSNRLGEQVVKDWNTARRQFPDDTECFAVTHALVASAYKKIGGTLPSLEPTSSEFACLFGSYIRHAKLWPTLDKRWRGAGAPGAMASIGRAQLVGNDEVWAGRLLPGAVIQVWRTVEDYRNVVDGKPAQLGHSFVHLHYVRSGSAITGMVVADNGYHGRKVVTSDRWGCWIGGNLTLPLGDYPKAGPDERDV